MFLNLEIFPSGLYNLFQYFVIYAFCGWLMEVAYAFHIQKKFVNRGFLYGPFCPMYGVGAVLLIIFLDKPLNVVWLFVIAVVITSGLEYVTGYILEKIFKEKWWDYTEDAFNLHGRICLSFSLLWGVLAVLFIKFVHPFTAKYLNIHNTTYGTAILNLIVIYFIVDLICTLISLVGFKNLLRQLDERSRELKNSLEELLKVENSEDKDIKIQTLSKELKERFSNIYDKLSSSRLAKAFPQFSIKPINKIKEEFLEKFQYFKDKN